MTCTGVTVNDRKRLLIFFINIKKAATLSAREATGTRYHKLIVATYRQVVSNPNW